MFENLVVANIRGCQVHTTGAGKCQCAIRWEVSTSPLVHGEIVVARQRPNETLAEWKVRASAVWDAYQNGG